MQQQTITGRFVPLALFSVLAAGCGNSSSTEQQTKPDLGPDILVCPEGQTPCGVDCVELPSDPRHCGRCGNDCSVLGEAECREGRCVFVGTCTPPEKACNNRCVDVTTDNFNCGDCEVPCPIERYFHCVGGGCVCLEGRNECMGHCVNTLTDEIHCGECNNKCEQRELCTDGHCVEQP